jgi:hypothetical protein
MVLKIGHFGKWTRNAWKVFKYGALEGWRRSVGLIVWEMKKYYKEFYILLTVHPCIIMHISSTRCKILFNIFIYFSSLHVSAIHMPIIRRKLLYFCFTDICHCVWLESGQTRRNPYRVTNISDAQIQQFSPDDRHVDDRNM